MPHRIGTLFLKQLEYRTAVADIAPHEAKVFPLHHRRQGFRMAGVSQLVQAYDPILRMALQLIKNKIGANKTCSARHQNRHARPSFLP